MKKAVVVGGSNGIGLALCKCFIQKGYYIEVLDRESGDLSVLPQESYHYTQCDLLYFNDEPFVKLAQDPEVEVLMVTAGIGRVALFQAHHIAEIEKMFTINTVSVLKIFRIFYDRILSPAAFYAGVMGSISGWMSSPVTAVYAASKAGVIRFVESVNIELELGGTDNRILDVSPASFKGSRFYNGKNDLSITLPLAEEITKHLYKHDTRFIPDYEKTFKGVLKRYHQDPHEYGIHSYKYKEESGRLDNKEKVVIGHITGSFSCLDVELIRKLAQEKSRCDYLIAELNIMDEGRENDTCPSVEDRILFLESNIYVDKVVVNKS